MSSEQPYFDPEIQKPSLWFNRDIDLIVRRDIFGEVNPKPYIVVENYIHLARKLDEIVDVQFLGEVKVDGRIDEQEERLQGLNRYATEEQRAYIWLAERGKCGYCKENVGFLRGDKVVGFQADHVVPVYFNGKTVINNLVCSCKKCNVAKGVADGEQFLNMLNDADNPIAERDMLYHQNKG